MKYSVAYLVLTVASLIIINPTAALAVDYYVDGLSGDDANSGLSPGDAFKTITYALDVIQPSEETPATISVAAGTYSASTNGETFPLALKSHLALVGSHPEATLLDAEQRGGKSVISCSNVSSVTISGLGIMNALSKPALTCTSSRLVVRGCHFRNNYNGSVFSDGDRQGPAHIAIESSVFVGNSGVCVDICSYYFMSSQGEVTSSAFTLNTGSVFASNGGLTASECFIQANEARVYDESGGDLLIEKTVIRDNASEDNLFLGAPSVIRHCVIEGNASSGHLFQASLDCVIRSCVIEGNTSGGSIFCLVSGGFWLDWHMGTLLVEDSLIARNVPGSGSLIRTEANYYVTRCPAVLMRTPLSDDQELIDVRRSTIADNGRSLASRRGERETITASSDGLPVQDCILSDNTVRFDVHWDNMQGYYSEPYNIDHSCLQQEYEGEGNFAADPLFVSGPLGDYYLSSTAAGQDADSPCIDAGSTSASIAGVGNLTTRTDGAFDTGVVDIGYHYSATPPTIQASVANLTNPSAPAIPHFAPGESLSASVAVENGGLPLWVDIYAAFILPDGTLFCVGPDGLTTDLVSWTATSLLPSNFNSGDVVVFEAQMPEGLQEGSYTFAAALSLTGEFRPIGDIAFAGFAVQSSKFKVGS